MAPIWKSGVSVQCFHLSLFEIALNVYFNEIKMNPTLSTNQLEL